MLSSSFSLERERGEKERLKNGEWMNECEEHASNWTQLWTIKLDSFDIQAFSMLATWLSRDALLRRCDEKERKIYSVNQFHSLSITLVCVRLYMCVWLENKEESVQIEVHYFHVDYGLRSKVNVMFMCTICTSQFFLARLIGIQFFGITR